MNDLNPIARTISRHWRRIAASCALGAVLIGSRAVALEGTDPTPTPVPPNSVKITNPTATPAASAGAVAKPAQSPEQARVPSKIAKHAEPKVIISGLETTPPQVMPTTTPVPQYGGDTPRPPVADYQEDPNDLLRRAFREIDEARNDYNGHRLNALDEIRSVLPRLRIVHRRGGSTLNQRDADQHLHNAHALLQRASKVLGRNQSGDDLRHANAALRELDMALQGR